MSKKRYSYEEKKKWILERFKTFTFGGFKLGEGENEEAFAERFGCHLKIYTIGPNVCPNLTDTLRQMFERGELRRCVYGNQMARQYCQKTWGLYYYLPDGKSGETYREYCSRPITFRRRLKNG